MDTIIQKIDAKPGQRIIAMSDIHGQPDYILQLLRKLHYHGDDILVIVGDLAEKGSDSLQAVRYIMDLHSKNQVYISAGNVDEHLAALLWDETDGWKQRFCDFVHWQHNVWHHGLILDMLTGLGISPEHITPENTASYRKRLQKHYAPEISFLRRLPTILDGRHPQVSVAEKRPLPGTGPPLFPLCNRRALAGMSLQTGRAEHESPFRL